MRTGATLGFSLSYTPWQPTVEMDNSRIIAQFLVFLLINYGQFTLLCCQSVVVDVGLAVRDGGYLTWLTMDELLDNAIRKQLAYRKTCQETIMNNAK